jgi:hypothetical protein
VRVKKKNIWFTVYRLTFSDHKSTTQRIHDDEFSILNLEASCEPSERTVLDVGDEAQGQQHGPQVKAQTLGRKRQGDQDISSTTSSVVGRRMLDQLASIMSNFTLPLHEIVAAQNSSFSKRLLHPACKEERFRGYFILSAVRTYKTHLLWNIVLSKITSPKYCNTWI